MKNRTRPWAYAVFAVTLLVLGTSCNLYTHVKENVVPPVKAIVIDALPGMATASLEDVKSGIKWLLDKIGVPFEWTEEQLESLMNPSEGATEAPPTPPAEPPS